MRTARSFVVVPSLPDNLKPLKEIAYNLWWTWDHDAIDMFRRLDRELWKASNHNPVMMLGKMKQERLEKVSRDDGFLAHLERVCKKMDAYMRGPRWYDSIDHSKKPATIAYFSAEFGLHESLPIYSGGLGVLAGDHLKSASDLGVPLVAMGLLYRQGYFQQYLNADGWQQESYPENDFYNMPIKLVKHEDGRPIRFHIDIAGRDVVVQVWRVQVGRVDLYLLDTNLRCNRLEDRQITAQLYGGDNNMRIRQEMLLGIGGFSALKTLGIEPAVCHMNEGHAAFLALERIRRIMEEHRVSFAEAREATISGNVFTTHTPVPAGHDVFSAETMEKYLGDYAKQFGIGFGEILGLGRINPNNANEPFSMTYLAIRLSTYRNGVSQLHGEVSRRMCQPVWPEVPMDEVPITSITNGIHVSSWVSREMSEVLVRYLGPGWNEYPHNTAAFTRIDQIPDEELWRTHERRREQLVAFARHRLREQLSQRGASPTEIATADEVLDPEALTIVFARRFAAYKRATLLFHDPERLRKIITEKERPVQIIFAGKAHPRDTAGKELIRKAVHMAREEELRRRIVFLENYDINLARFLVQGADVWLNTPRRGMEASGTSGMKVLTNGGINLSILDGWWCEGYSHDTGWAIGSGESYTDTKYQDEVESHTIYDLLEKDVVPLFYQRGSDRLPRGWVKMMKNSMRKLSSHFSTSRMVAEYAQTFYLPCALRWEAFEKDALQRAKGLAAWKESMRDRWPEVSIGKVDIISKGELLVGSKMQVRCQVALGSIDPNDVLAELYYGLVDGDGNIASAEAVPMKHVGAAQGDYHIFNGSISCRRSGLCGFTVRVIPYHADLVSVYDTALIRWEEPEGERSKAKAVPQELV
ncbi:MAG: alpha-glucan phosphorylase [Phycisphaerae bacterium SM23_30]|nr:MAG: alpha-glucan phosphorylase [Phycisphaerae bacterium SM23_30]